MTDKPSETLLQTEPARDDAKVRTHILRLASSMTKECLAVARIHQSELPDSALSVLGTRFLATLYYGSLLEDPDYFCYVCLIDETVAGFIAFSTNSRKVCQQIMKRSRTTLVWMALATIFRHPAAIPALFKMALSFLSLKDEPFAEVPAETMSTAIAKPYRSAEFYRRTGIKVAHELYMTMAQVLYERGVTKIKGFTRKSNVLVNATISFLGWKKVFEGTLKRGFGAEETCVWTWDLAAAAQRFNYFKIETQE